MDVGIRVEAVGRAVGEAVGRVEGSAVGEAVGRTVGEADGLSEGFIVSDALGRRDGAEVLDIVAPDVNTPVNVEAVYSEFDSVTALT